MTLSDEKLRQPRKSTSKRPMLVPTSADAPLTTQVTEASATAQAPAKQQTNTPALPMLPAETNQKPLDSSAESIAAERLSSRAKSQMASALTSARKVTDRVDDVIPPLRLAPARRPTQIHRKDLSWMAGAAVLLLLPILVAVLATPKGMAISPWGGPPDRVPRGASAWADATIITPQPATDAAFGAQTYPVDAAFAKTYSARNGQALLGDALTPAFICNLGNVQFFAKGALLLPSSASSSDSQDANGKHGLDPALAHEGVRDPATGVIWLPLAHTLLSAGSKAPLGGDSSSATYVTLRNATRVVELSQKPAQASHLKPNAPLPQTLPLDQGAFVVEGSREGKLVGHLIPAPIWAFINSPQVAPDGWAGVFGEPVTEALTVDAMSAGQPRHLLVQAFWQTIVVSDLDNPQNTTIQPIGLDYLHTLGAPAAYQTSGVQLWTTQDGALRTAPGETNVAVSLNTNSAVALTGATAWAQGQLWLSATWTSPTRNGTAWVEWSALTATKPTSPASVGFDLLSPDLANYLNGQGGNVGAVAYDITRNVEYTYQPNGQFTMASSAKVPLMVAYLQYIESQGRGPNSYDMSLMSAMIENSDNNSAEVIYDTLGYDAGQRQSMQSWGINDYIASPDGWGWAQWSPADMAHLLMLVQTGKILNATDRATALNLMQNVESDQRFGAGDSAPANATVALKDGWVNEPDGAWAVNTSGIVSTSTDVYIVAVYTKEQGSFGSGQDIVNHICGAIAQALQ